ncbi:hypothetical protein ACIBCD_33745 [Nocardia brasiliensis]|uniref:hypothetical protein n=1 Tax=Nocardia brasiliensis TaxID=37326 RepID=UPI0037BCA174
MDSLVAERLTRKRPWGEPALTSLLCDLLDEDTCDDYPSAYGLSRLQQELQRTVPLLNFDCTIQTHEYPPNVERWVTQSDLGLIVQVNDYLVPDNNREGACLLQAKRLYPVPGTGGYSSDCRYGGHDAEQQRRAQAINQLLGHDLIKYLLYCPRPDALPARDAATLRHVRDSQLANDLHDGPDGLELHAMLQQGSPRLDAGIIVSPIDAIPATLRATYEGLFQDQLPWSWFLTWWIVGLLNRGPDMVTKRDRSDSLAFQLAAGNSRAVAHLEKRKALDTSDSLAGARFRILPAHTLTITATVDSER